jgi:putative transposase
MPNTKRILMQGYCYHLITRGNQQQNVFRSKNDRLKYLELLKKFKRKYRLRLYAYCLMPNHVHLLGETEQIKLISDFMRDLNRTYTFYFNKKYNKVGHLWQSRFKSKIICKDKYLIDCLNYIEFNPLRAKLVKNPTEYPWSSYSFRALGKEDKLIDGLPID